MQVNDFNQLEAQVRMCTMRLVARLGTYAAAADAKMSRDTLARACGGLPLRRGTVFALANHFGLLTAAPATPRAIATNPVASDI